MSTTPLSTDFKDDILASANPKRKYQMIYNDDGSVSFTDVTQYDQTGSIFGAKEVNEERAAINNIDERRLVTLDEIDLVTEEGYFVDAKAVAELNSKTEILNKTDQSPGSALKFRDATEPGYTNLTFGYWENGIYLYPGYLDGAPTDWAGLLLVFEDGTSLMKYAFTFGGTIYSMRQKKSDGTISLGWTKI